MKKLINWSIIRYPSDSNTFELQGQLDFGYEFLVIAIPEDFESFDIDSKVGVNFSGESYQLEQFIPNNVISDENEALKVIKEWTILDLEFCKLKRPLMRGVVCSCDEEDDE